MESSLAQKAVALALSGNWHEAIEVNLEILSTNPEDIDALNRLARCYAETGLIEKAVKTTQKVLEIDQTNSIATKCLQKWKTAKPNNGRSSPPPSGEIFLEESGKTRMITLFNPGNSSVLSNLDSGDEVKLAAFAHKVSVVDNDEKYIGRLPDDIAARLRNILKQGGKYQVLVKSIDSGSNEVTVFIRELENKSGVASFPPEKIDYVSFTPPELVHKDIPEMPSIEEAPEQ